MDLRGDPRVRAEVIPDDEEEEEFQDSREDQPNQLLVSSLNPPPASEFGSAWSEPHGSSKYISSGWEPICRLGRGGHG